MRRIALAAALAATLAGGAAALAATPDAATPDAAPPDPYQGAWAVMLDGRYAGPVTQVQGCGLAAQVVTDAHLGYQPTKHLADPAPEACTFAVGQGMSPDFYKFVDQGLVVGLPTPHRIELVRTDAAARYGLLVPHATLASVELPKVDRASTAAVFLEVGIGGPAVSRDPSPPQAVGPKAPAVSGFDPAQLKVGVAGTDLGATSAGPWAAKVGIDAAADSKSGAGRTEVDLGDVPLRVPDGTKPMTQILDPWVHSALVDGAANAEQTVQLTLGGLSLTFLHAAPQRADLVPRADGARTYSLYTEQAVVAPN